MVDYDSFEEFRDPETYDLICDAYDEDRPLIEYWAKQLGAPLLDLACGTGRMAIHMTKLGYRVTGVDVVPEMIEYGKQKAAKQSVSIEWVLSDARNFHLGKQFTCVFMLENAFQFFPTRADHEALLACVHEHLHENGVFIFETRNPSVRNLYELRLVDGQHYTLPDGRQLSITEEASYDPITQIQHFVTHRHWTLPDGRHEEKTLHGGLRYTFPQELEALLHYNGFQIHARYGNWQQDPLTADSPAMVLVCKKRA